MTDDARARLETMVRTNNGFEIAELDLELTSDPVAIREFESKHGRVSAVVVANCLPTNTRQPLHLARSDVDPGRWSGTLELDCDNFRGRIALVTTLTATVGGVLHRPVACGEHDRQ